MRLTLLVFTVVLLAACATAPERPVSANDPSNPDAPVPPPPRVAEILAPDASALGPAEQGAESEHAGHGGHAGMNMQTGAADGGAAAPSPHAGHGGMQTGAVPPQRDAGEAPTGAHAGDAGVQLYTCVMHPEVVSEKPGRCPKCGMKLVPKKAAPEAGSTPDAGTSGTGAGHDMGGMQMPMDHGAHGGMSMGLDGGMR